MPEKIPVQETTNLEKEKIFICCFPICYELYEDPGLRFSIRGKLENLVEKDSSFKEIPDDSKRICVYYLQSVSKDSLISMIDTVSSNYNIKYQIV